MMLLRLRERFRCWAGFRLVLTQRAGMSEADLDKYRVSRLVPLMPDFYVGDPAALEKYVDGARKMQGMVGAFTSAFKK